MHSEHVKTALVEFVERSESLQRRRDGDVAPLTEALKECGSLGRREHALSGVDDRLLGVGDEVRGLLERGVGDGSGVGAGGGGGGVGAVAGGEGPLGELGVEVLGGDGLAKDTGGDVLGEVDEDGSRAARGSDLKRLVDPARELSDVLDHDVPLGATARDADDIGLLERVGSNRARRDLTAEDDEGSSVREGVLHGRDHVRRSGSRGNEDDSRLAGDASVSLGHVSSALLVTGEDKVKVGRVVDGVKNGEDRSSGVAKDLVDLVTEHHLVKDLSAREADEGGVKLFAGRIASERRGGGSGGRRGSLERRGRSSAAVECRPQSVRYSSCSTTPGGAEDEDGGLLGRSPLSALVCASQASP